MLEKKIKNDNTHVCFKDLVLVSFESLVVLDSRVIMVSMNNLKRGNQ